MKRIIAIFLLAILLASCSQSEPITFPYIIAGTNGYPLLKYSTKSCTVSALCPDIYCEHRSAGSADEICEFALCTGYPIISSSGVYYTRQSEKEPDNRMYFDLKYYDYADQSIRLISSRDYMTGLYYQNGSLWWWEHFYAESNPDKVGSHLYRYDEDSGKITRLTDESNFYGSDSTPWLGYPKLMYADDDTLIFDAYPELYRSDPKLKSIEQITLTELVVPSHAVLRYGGGYLHDGWYYYYQENGESHALYRRHVKTGKTEVLAQSIVCFVMDDDAVYYQPYYTENAEIYTVSGVSKTNRSKGQILQYNLDSGETIEILNNPSLHFEETLYLQEHVLMVRMYGIVVNRRDGSESYDVLPHAMFYKDGKWLMAEYNG